MMIIQIFLTLVAGFMVVVGIFGILCTIGDLQSRAGNVVGPFSHITNDQAGERFALCIFFIAGGAFIVWATWWKLFT